MATWSGEQPPEGRLIEATAKASGRSARFLAANAHMSDTHWRNIVRGWRPGPDGEPVAVPAPALTLARMAWAVGLNGEALNEVGRADAAEILEDLRERYPHNWQPLGRHIDVTVDEPGSVVSVSGTSYVGATATAAGVGRVSATGFVTQGPDEIDLIYASTRMSAREKLLRIRQVLELRALAEADEARKHEEAPTETVGAEPEEASQN